jgi:hypothetical protein
MPCSPVMGAGPPIGCEPVTGRASLGDAFATTAALGKLERTGDSAMLIVLPRGSAMLTVPPKGWSGGAFFEGSIPELPCVLGGRPARMSPLTLAGPRHPEK